MSDSAALAKLLGTDAKGKSSFDAKFILSAARRFYWIVLLFTVVALTVAFAYLKTTTPVYRAVAEMRIEHRPVIITQSGTMSDSGVGTDADLLTLEKSFLSRDLFQRVAEKLDPESCRKLVGLNDGEPADTAMVAAALAGGSGIELVEGTRLMNISFDNSDPALATRVANLLLEEGIELDTDQRVNAVDSNIKFLQGESEKGEEKLKASEQKLNDYIKKLGTVSIDDNMNLVADQFRTMHGRYVEARAERLKLEADYGNIKEAKGDPDKLILVESIQKVPAVAQLMAKDAELQQAISDMSMRYGPDNPHFQHLLAQRQEVRQDLRKELLAAPATIESSIAMAQASEDSLKTEDTSQEQEVIQIKEASVDSKVLQRQIDADKLAYETILHALNEELSQVRAQPVILQIVEKAVDASKIKPKPLQVLLIAVFVGIAVGVGLVLLLLQLDSSIRSVEDAEQAFGLPVLAVVPRSVEPSESGSKVVEKAPRASLPENWKLLPVFVDKHSTSAEAFRTLNASVQMLQTGTENFTLVTSSIPGEGKSYVCLNAATAIALSGRRTLLVDADLRKPVIESRFFGSRSRGGLADYLSGRLDFEEVITSSGLLNLDIVASGKFNADPTELLSRGRFKAFLEEARTRYDHIIFDSAPVTVVSDTLCFAQFFHVVCVVTKAGKTPKGAAKRTLELLRRAGAAPSGIVINFVTKDFHSGYYGYYNQYYGHKEPAAAAT